MGLGEFAATQETFQGGDSFSACRGELATGDNPTDAHGRKDQRRGGRRDDRPIQPPRSQLDLRDPLAVALSEHLRNLLIVLGQLVVESF
ncbi:MAG: hypothetical protein KDA71_25865 [Planctomycetales bacterium]|nr:hypothetical protein [Planctomycetales bacterium]